MLLVRELHRREQRPSCVQRNHPQAVPDLVCELQSWCLKGGHPKETRPYGENLTHTERKAQRFYFLQS